MDSAATALGMSSQDLRSALHSGDTVASLAAAKGVSLDTLTSAIKTALQQANPHMGAQAVTRITDRIVNGGAPTTGRSTPPPTTPPPTTPPPTTTSGTSIDL